MCFKCDKEGHIIRDCKGKQMMRKRKIQKGSDNEDKKKKRVLAKISSRHGTRDLLCKFLE